MSYKISFSKKSKKELSELDKSLRSQVFKKILELRKNPQLGKPLSNLLKNKRSIHIGKYRVLYVIADTEVLISRIKHRKDVYK